MYSCSRRAPHGRKGWQAAPIDCTEGRGAEERFVSEGCRACKNMGGAWPTCSSAVRGVHGWNRSNCTRGHQCRRLEHATAIRSEWWLCREAGGFAVPLMAPPATSGNGGELGLETWRYPKRRLKAMCFAPMALRRPILWRCWECGKDLIDCCEHLCWAAAAGGSGGRRGREAWRFSGA